jgi:hypothetical protein
LQKAVSAPRYTAIYVSFSFFVVVCVPRPTPQENGRCQWEDMIVFAAAVLLEY